MNEYQRHITVLYYVNIYIFSKRLVSIYLLQKMIHQDSPIFSVYRLLVCLADKLVHVNRITCPLLADKLV